MATQSYDLLLNELPLDVLFCIMDYVQLFDYLKLALVCRDFQTMVNYVCTRCAHLSIGSARRKIQQLWPFIVNKFERVQTLNLFKSWRFTSTQLGLLCRGSNFANLKELNLIGCTKLQMDHFADLKTATFTKTLTHLAFQCKEPTAIDVPQVEFLKSFENLKHLHLLTENDVSVGNGFSSCLPPGLVSLTLESFNSVNVSLILIHCKFLKSLSLTTSSITELYSGEDSLELTHLDLSWTGCSAEMLTQLGNKCPYLELLNISNNTISKTDFVALATKLPGLNTVVLPQYTRDSILKDHPELLKVLGDPQ